MSALLAEQMLVLFAILAIGSWLGGLAWRGVSLGTAAVFFVGLAFGALSPDMVMPPVIVDIGLIIFVYTIGLSSGPGFFASFKRKGLRDNTFVFLLLLASLESLPGELFEAARVDGASAWQELRHVILPLMLPALVVTLVFRLIVSFKVFDEVYLLTGGGPGTATEVLSFTIYRRFFTEDRMGYGSAISVLTLFALALLILLVLYGSRRFRKED